MTDDTVKDKFLDLLTAVVLGTIVGGVVVAFVVLIITALAKFLIWAL